MELVNVTIAHIGDRYASGGFDLVGMNVDKEKALRTPKLKPGEVVRVPRDHWLAAPEMGRRMMVTDEPPTRPYSFANTTEAKEYKESVTRTWIPRCTPEIIQESVDFLVAEMQEGRGKLVKTKKTIPNRRVTMRAQRLDFSDANPDNATSLGELHGDSAPTPKRRGRMRRG